MKITHNQWGCSKWISDKILWPSSDQPKGLPDLSGTTNRIAPLAEPRPMGLGGYLGQQRAGMAAAGRLICLLIAVVLSEATGKGKIGLRSFLKRKSLWAYFVSWVLYSKAILALLLLYTWGRPPGFDSRKFCVFYTFFDFYPKTVLTL